MKWKQPLAFLLLTALFLFVCRRTLGCVLTRDGASHPLTVHGYARHDLLQIGPYSRILRVELDDGTLLPS